MEPDTHNPNRWQKVKLCKTADHEIEKNTFKETIIDVCNKRGDTWGEDVRICVEGALSDLHAADARYHDVCRKNFMNERLIKSAAASKCTSLIINRAFKLLVQEMNEDVAKTWESVSLYNQYESCQEERLSRRYLIRRLQEHYGDSLLILSSPGVASIIMSRSRASEMMQIVDYVNDDNIALEKLAKVVRKECEVHREKQEKFPTRIFQDSLMDAASPTLMTFLSQINSKLDNTQPALLISNIITSLVANSATDLQISLGVLVCKKSLINHLNLWGVTCTYDEVKRFKASAAIASVTEKSMKGISDASNELVQTVVDNFDCNISSTNGLKSTHSLAALMTQKKSGDPSNTDVSQIKRIEKDKMKSKVPSDVRLKLCIRPAMAENDGKQNPLPLKVLASQTILLTRAHVLDFQFLNDVCRDPQTPEFGGYKYKNKQGTTTLYPTGNKSYL